MRCGTWLVMARTRSWCAADITSILDPSACQNRPSFATASVEVPSGGVNMHHRFTNNVANPASGPDCSVPATGCAGTRWACSGRWGAIAAITSVFTEPTSDTTAPGFSAGPTSRAIASFAPTGAQKITRSARAAADAVGRYSSPRPSASARRRTSREASAKTIAPAALTRRAARAIEDPISPTPTMATQSKTGSANSGPSLSTMTHVLRESGQRFDDPSIGRLGPDRQAQTVGKPIGPNRAEDESARAQIRVRRRRTAIPRKTHEHEIADAGNGLESDSVNPLADPRQPMRIVRRGRGHVTLVRDRRTPGGERRGVDVERTPHPVQRRNHGRRRVGPPQTQARQSMNLRKRAQHNHVFATRDQFHARRVIIFLDIFRIGRVENEKDFRRHCRLKSLDFLDWQIGAGRIVRIGEEYHPRTRVDFGEQSVDAGCKPLLRRGHGNPSGRQDDDRVFEETVLGIQPFVAGAEVHVREQRDQLVRTVAADDVFGVETMVSRNGRPQIVRGTIRI